MLKVDNLFTKHQQFIIFTISVTSFIVAALRININASIDNLFEIFNEKSLGNLCDKLKTSIFHNTVTSLL